MSTRQDVVTCLTELGDLLSPSANQPSTLAGRMAWPALSRFESAQAGWAYEATWEVWVVLPGDDPAARDTWFEAHAVDIAEALRPCLLVDTIERTVFGELPAALFTGRSE